MSGIGDGAGQVAASGWAFASGAFPIADCRQQRLAVGELAVRRRQRRTCQDQHRQAHFPRHLELRLGGLATAVLAHQHVAGEALEQRPFAIQAERPARADHLGARRGRLALQAAHGPVLVRRDLAEMLQRFAVG